MLISWTPCLCRYALDADQRGRGLGHLTLRCTRCEDEGHTAVYSEPPHDPAQPHARL